MRRRLLALPAALAAALVLALGAVAGNGTPVNTASKNPLTLAVIGDVPYGAEQLAAFPEGWRRSTATRGSTSPSTSATSRAAA
jgi:hypothetical protein